VDRIPEKHTTLRGGFSVPCASNIVKEHTSAHKGNAPYATVRDGARGLFPISLAPFADIRHWECFDADAGKDSAREIREYSASLEPRRSCITVLNWPSARRS
jgi:hypothetical protein